MAHSIDHYAERQRRQRTPQDRFELRDGDTVIDKRSSYALAVMRRDELIATDQRYAGLVIRDTWGKS